MTTRMGLLQIHCPDDCSYREKRKSCQAVEVAARRRWSIPLTMRKHTTGRGLMVVSRSTIGCTSQCEVGQTENQKPPGGLHPSEESLSLARFFHRADHCHGRNWKMHRAAAETIDVLQQRLESTPPPFGCVIVSLSNRSGLSRFLPFQPCHHRTSRSVFVRVDVDASNIRLTVVVIENLVEGDRHDFARLNGDHGAGLSPISFADNCSRNCTAPQPSSWAYSQSKAIGSAQRSS